ncbi:MAG: hypothetical protein V3U96_03645 [Paracoccaceae bacterium]
MAPKHEWLFDALWELSDEALAAGMPVLAGKLEAAMDTYLNEQARHTARKKRHTARNVHLADSKPTQVAARLIRQMEARAQCANLWAAPEPEPETQFQSSRASVAS